MKSIYLVGFMGSGKTSILEELQKKLVWSSQDTDNMIEETYEMTIPEIFRDKGEARFRDYETAVLKKTQTTNTIIATGGGIIEREENCDWLRENGIVFFLDTSWEEIARRLKHDQSRPIWNNQSRDKQKLLHRRLPNYKLVADYIINTDQKDLDEIAEEIIAKLSE